MDVIQVFGLGVLVIGALVFSVAYALDREGGEDEKA